MYHHVASLKHMYHIMRNSTASSRNDPLYRWRIGLFASLQGGTPIPFTTGAMKNVTNPCIQLERKLARAISLLTGWLAASHRVASDVRGTARRPCHRSQHGER